MKRILIRFGLILLILFLAACSLDGEPAQPATTTSAPIPTETNPPEDTPTPLPPVGLFLTPPDADPGLVEELSPLIGEYIRQQDLRFQVLTGLTEADFSSDEFALVVVLEPFPALGELAAAAPQTRFLGIGFNQLEPTENLSLLHLGGGDYDIQGFIAGYIAALITTDWRVGALSLQENPDAEDAREGFRVGVKYYCGLCNPKYAPTGINYLYPKYIDLPQDASEVEIAANVDFLVDRAVNTFYIVPGVGTPQIYSMLVGYQKNIIGSGIDFREEYRDYWVVSLEYDLLAALNEFWPAFLEAETGEEYTAPLLLTDVNPDFLGEGKLKLVEGVLQEVSSGFIQTSFE